MEKVRCPRPRTAAGTSLFGYLLAAVLLAVPGTSARAAPLAAAPTLTAAPQVVRPGATIRVVASGLTAPPGAVLCLGMLGPGRNVERGIAPAFRVRVGTISIGANGTGSAAVTVPGELTGGTYRLIVGGCAPQPGLAPLAALAATTLTVAGPAAAPTPPRLPATGGLPRPLLDRALAAAILLTAAGTALRFGAGRSGHRTGRRGQRAGGSVGTSHRSP